MSLFDLLFGSGGTDDYYTAGDPGRAQAADYQATNGGWFEPAPPPGRRRDPARLELPAQRLAAGHPCRQPRRAAHP